MDKPRELLYFFVTLRLALPLDTDTQNETIPTLRTTPTIPTSPTTLIFYIPRKSSSAPAVFGPYTPYPGSEAFSTTPYLI